MSGWPFRRFAGRREHKFNADTSGGGSSKLERSVHALLLLREKSGEIDDIKRQCSVELGIEIVISARTQKERRRIIRWKVDFCFRVVKTDERMWAEAKGIETRLYRKQLRLWREGAGPGRIEIWKGNYRRPRLVEIVEPKKEKDT